MAMFIMGLYILAANGFVIPDPIWTISWVLLGFTCFCAVAKALKEALEK